MIIRSFHWTTVCSLPPHRPSCHRPCPAGDPTLPGYSFPVLQTALLVTVIRRPVLFGQLLGRLYPTRPSFTASNPSNAKLCGCSFLTRIARNILGCSEYAKRFNNENLTSNRRMPELDSRPICCHFFVCVLNHQAVCYPRTNLLC